MSQMKYSTEEKKTQKRQDSISSFSLIDF